ncbi:hypothetical protein [Beggiatoa leptomitoformis]|uniref:hypothetical protein n=1 Tax=Beggiatoa leptomitoformis TaxID=288004 RepID=UPI0007069CBF|nr:hypothetical protein [Beggiatoa leptomitoformis]
MIYKYYNPSECELIGDGIIVGVIKQRMYLAYLLDAFNLIIFPEKLTMITTCDGIQYGGGGRTFCV